MSHRPLTTFDIGHDRYSAIIEPETAFWSLAPTADLHRVLLDPEYLGEISARERSLDEEMRLLRFGLLPSAVYFNPTERCNLNCTYCYLPEKMRRGGKHMTENQIFAAMELLLEYFGKTLPATTRPQVIFHGSEPMLNRRAVLAAIDRYSKEIAFGVQTNGTLLDAETIGRLIENQVSIGLSLDGPAATITDLTRHTHGGRSIHGRVISALEALRGYPNHSVISTVTTKNLAHLRELVDLLHGLEVPTCMLNPVRCTLPGARSIRPDDGAFASAYIAALERTYQLYRETGRKLIVANFANAILAVIAPTARRLMCDISPCGGGRCFFAVDANGGLFPCSEFIGLPEFQAGNLFDGGLESCFASDAFTSITTRTVEQIDGCRECAIRNYCGAPCPAEACALHETAAAKGAFCDFYREQFRFIFRLIADGLESAYLWDSWDSDAITTFDLAAKLPGSA